MAEQRVVVVSGASIRKLELLELMGKHVIIEPASFGPAHTLPYDQERMRELRDKFLQAPPPPRINNRNSMRKFVRSHSRRGRR
ncbi:hypothetical protein D3C76_622250 [compost metagenome]